MTSDAKGEGSSRSWPELALVLIALVGAGIGGLMTWHHDVQLFGDASMQGALIGCTTNEEVNCDIVNTSEYSEFLSVPIATWGIAIYLLIAGLALRVVRGRRELLPVILVLGVGATLYSGFLFAISKLQLSYVCAWCIRLYVINFAIPTLAVIAGALKAPRPTGATLGMVLGTFALLVGLSVGGERTFRSGLLGSEAAGTRLATAEVSDAIPPKAAGDDTIFADPQGNAPTLNLPVKTERNSDAILHVRSDDAWKGNRDASVVLVEFADLECGYCKRASGQLRRLYDVYKADVLFVFKHFPMDPACNPGVKNKRHRRACRAAWAAVCMQRQGRFWAFHDLAFKNQHRLKDKNLRFYAEAIGVDMARFDACMQDPAAAAVVADDARDGATVEVHGTPRIFIDGRLYRSGSSAEQMAAAIERALGKSAIEARDAAKAMRRERSVRGTIPSDLPEMQRVTYGSLDFEIDTFESGLDISGSVPKATQGVHQVPATRMSWFAASDACNAAGKRLCTEREWLGACQGAEPVDDDGNGQYADDMVEGNAYPYSDYHSPGRCWDGHARGVKCGTNRDEKCRPVYTGEMPGCVTTDGVYDLTGNVEEWVGASAESAVLLGGSFDTSRDHARCYRRNDTYGPGFANERTGFRCCRDH